jgi:hypothetical protein
MEFLGQGFSEEDNVRLHKTVATRTMRYLPFGNSLLHLSFRVRRLAVNTVLRREATMGLDNFLAWDSCQALQAINVLCKVFQQQSLIVQ